MTYDAVIVGAGPGGSYLGYLLAKDGHKVALIDKESFPRDKVCGGGLSAKTLDLLKFDLTPILQRKIHGAYLTFRNRDTVIKDLRDVGGAMVLRRDFDHFLLEQARNKGASFFPKCPFTGATRSDGWITVETPGRTLKARHLFGADGVSSQVRNRLFGKDLVTYAPAIEALIHVPESVLEKFRDRALFDFGGMPGGYGWIFPKTDHLNAGVFSPFGAKNIRADLQRFIADYRSLSHPAKITYVGFCIPVKNRRNVYERENIWLIGDAAGLAEPLFGEGIYYALRSAAIAHRSFRESFEGRGKNVYTRNLEKELLPELTYAGLNAKWLYSFQRFGFYRMVRNAHVNGYFTKVLTGELTSMGCLYRTILTAPYWLFSRNLKPASDIPL